MSLGHANPFFAIDSNWRMKEEEKNLYGNYLRALHCPLMLFAAKAANDM